jgi:hypothetical protein
MKRILIILAVILCLTPILIGQEKYTKKATEYYNSEQYEKAIDYFLLAKESNMDFDILLKLGYSYSKLHNPETSVVYYKKARLIKWPFPNEYMLDYGNVLRQLEKYKEAKDVYNTMPSAPLQMIKSCDWVKQSNNIDYKVTVDSVALNDEYSINGFYKLKDDILYPSLEKNMNYSFNWYNVKTNKTSNFVNYNWQYNLNSPNIIGDSILIYSGSSSKEKFFSERALKKGIISNNNENKLSLWELNFNDKPVAKKLKFTNVNYGYLHPYFDSESSKLFFISDMPGGYGGLDIYFVEKNDDGWSRPVNVGPRINTEYDEAYPYVKGNLIFFSSEGHVGYGGFDIFMIDYLDNRSQSINMGIPFNSSKDDFSYREDSINKGCFISNRKNETGRDYLWMFERHLNDSLINKNSLSDNLKNIEIKDSSLLFEGDLLGEPVEVDNDLLLGEIDNLNSLGGPVIIGLVSSEKSDRIGNTILGIPASTEKRKDSKDYLLRYELPIDTMRMDFVYYRDSCVVEIHRNVLETEIKVLVDNNGKKEIMNSFLIKKTVDYTSFNYLYFDFNSYNLIYSSIKDLRSLVLFLEKYPNIHIELAGYADIIGYDTYNQKLSRKRARAAYDFLKLNGVSKYRISRKGRGEKSYKKTDDDRYRRARMVTIKFFKVL